MNKKEIINKIIEDLPIPECRFEMSNKEWYLWFEEAFDKGVEAARHSFKPMAECNGFNMERILLINKNGYKITGYYKDGMILPDGDEQWTAPKEWDGFVRLKTLGK